MSHTHSTFPGTETLARDFLLKQDPAEEDDDPEEEDEDEEEEDENEDDQEEETDGYSE